MPQVTLYLDDECAALLNAAAARSGLPRSRWVAELIRRQAGDGWPAEVRALAGAFADFPLREGDGGRDMPADVPQPGF